MSRLVDITEIAYKKDIVDRTADDLASIEVKNGILKLKVLENNHYFEEDHEIIFRLIESIHSFKKNSRKVQRKVTMDKIRKQKLRQEH